MAPTTSSDGGSTTKKRVPKERLSTCSYCPMTFKKLEHAQRHERTHTLDRPYSCDTCGKTFARQDTLHRHTRLHSRVDDEGPTGKGPKKRRASSTSGAKPIVVNDDKPAKPLKPSPSSDRSNSASSSSSSSTNANASAAVSSSARPIAVVGDSEPVSEFSSSSAAFGLSMSLPVHPPSFPAYSQPEHHASVDPTFSALGNANSIDPAVLPLHRGVGDAGYGSRLPARRASYAEGGQSHAPTFALNANAPSRPRALTLAGLPESLGCFSLINSPASSTASLSPHEEEEGGGGGDDDLGWADSSMSDDDDVNDDKGDDPSWTAADSPSFPAPPESHYPSPAFSSYSPSALHNDSLTDLQAILDNDPIPSASFKVRERKASQQGSQLASVPEPDFDFEAFAASIEGAGPSSSAFESGTMPASLDELLGSHSTKSGFAGLNRYPTPPSDSVSQIPLPHNPDFDWINQYTSASVEAQQQAREDAAATAAMFSRGFGLDSAAAPLAATSSALGLSLGLPSPPLTGMSAHSHATASTLASPHISFPVSTTPMASSGIFANLHATYAATYPSFSLSLPVSATIVPSPIQATPTSNPHVSIPAQPPLGASTASASPSLHDLLAAAWERRQRGSNSPQLATGDGTASSIQHLPASINLKANASAVKATPAFYIPSALHSSPAQIGTQTSSDAHKMTVSASGPLSLPIPSWASMPASLQDATA